MAPAKPASWKTITDWAMVMDDCAGDDEDHGDHKNNDDFYYAGDSGIGAVLLGGADVRLFRLLGMLAVVDDDD